MSGGGVAIVISGDHVICDLGGEQACCPLSLAISSSATETGEKDKVSRAAFDAEDRQEDFLTRRVANRADEVGECATLINFAGREVWGSPQFHSDIGERLLASLD